MSSIDAGPLGLKDIAGKVGVSTTAVSNVLNNKPIRIGDAKRRLILHTARALHYRPNLAACSLKSKKARAIGIVVPDMTTLHYPELIRRLEVALFSNGYQTLICNSQDDGACEREHLAALCSRFVDGLAVVPAEGGINAPLLRRIANSGTLVLCVDIYLPKERFHYVTTDGRAAAREGALWLVNAGVKKLYYLGERRRHPVLDDRLGGVADAARLDPDAILLCPPVREHVHERLLPVLRRLPAGSGIFLESNRLLPGLLDAARDTGVTLPGRLRVIGFDPPVLTIHRAKDFSSWRMLTGPVPVIRQDVATMADHAAEYLTVTLANPSARFVPVRVAAELCLP
ncbi:MAG: LacI family transcriptional regulator [Lentisphaerae bacterium]|nr:LacI family transcriptional regulator [Lentisphaerota bacterium]